jgi:hypothetical protein
MDKTVKPLSARVLLLQMLSLAVFFLFDLASTSGKQAPWSSLPDWFAMKAQPSGRRIATEAFGTESGLAPSGLAPRPLNDDDLKNAKEELKAKKNITEEEVNLRLQILKNAARGIVDVPHGNKDQIRNPKYWKDPGGESPYVPFRGLARQAVKDLWNPLDDDTGLAKGYTEKILCTKLVGLTILKSYIDLAEARKDEASLKALDKAIEGKVLPDLDKPIAEEHESTAGYKPEELLPGDQVWFANPYYGLLTPELQKKDAYLGEEGSNTFYIGKKLFIRIYPDNPEVAPDVHFVYTLKEYQDRIRKWKSVKYAIAHQNDEPYTSYKDLFPVTTDKFPIRRRRTVPAALGGDPAQAERGAPPQRHQATESGPALVPAPTVR